MEIKLFFSSLFLLSSRNVTTHSHGTVEYMSIMLMEKNGMKIVNRDHIKKERVLHLSSQFTHVYSMPCMKRLFVGCNFFPLLHLVPFPCSYSVHTKSHSISFIDS